MVGTRPEVLGIGGYYRCSATFVKRGRVRPGGARCSSRRSGPAHCRCEPPYTVGLRQPLKSRTGFESRQPSTNRPARATEE